MGILHGIALLCICLRIFSRWYTMSRTGLDDWIIVAVLVRRTGGRTAGGATNCLGVAGSG